MLRVCGPVSHSERGTGVAPLRRDTHTVLAPGAAEDSGIPAELGSHLLPVRPTKDDGIIASFLTAMPESVDSVAVGDLAAVTVAERSYDCRQFWIRFANTEDRRGKAALLVARMYAKRGYNHAEVLRETWNTITLISHGPDGNVIGTVTIGMDSPDQGLLADGGYRDQLDQLRARGKRICEFTGFAIDPSVRSRLALARLFHIAVLYPWGMFGYTDCVIEVTPTHAGFYERLLRFERLGKARICPRVNTVGVLLHGDFSFVMERLEKVGGLMGKAVGDRSLYPYGFSKADADGILGRLKRMA